MDCEGGFDHCRVIVIDDVITAGTALSEALNILTAGNEGQGRVRVQAIFVAIDREEVLGLSQDDATGDKLSAAQSIERVFGLPVHSLLPMHALSSLLSTDSDVRRAIGASLADGQDLSLMLDQIDRYRRQYGAAV